MKPKVKSALSLMDSTIMNARYLLVVFYLACTVSLGAYIASSTLTAFHFLTQIGKGTEDEQVIGVLALLDAMMVANVIYLITAGSYMVYVRPRFKGKKDPDEDKRPAALQHLSPAVLKEKMAASLVGVSSVNLLIIMLHSHVTYKEALIKVGIHAILIVGFLVFWIVRKHETKEKREHELMLAREEKEQPPATPSGDWSAKQMADWVKAQSREPHKDAVSSSS